MLRWLRRWRVRGGRLVQWMDSHDGFVSAAATVVIAILTFFLATIAWQQTNILDLQRRINETVERPWISIEDTAVKGPLLFKNGKAMLEVTFTLKNTGHVPASNVLQDGSFFVRSPAPVELGRVWENCDDFRTKPLERRGTGISIFPEQQQQMSFWVIMMQDDVKRLTPSFQGAAILAGCVDYAFIGESARHQTRFVYEVDKRGANGETLLLNPAEGDVQTPDVILNLNPELAGNPD